MQRSPYHVEETLVEAKQRFFDGVFDRDSVCPCCDRKSSARKVTLGASHVKAMSLVYRHSPDDWLNVNAYGKDIGVRMIDLGYNDMRHFGLMEQNGSLWRLTEHGRAFIRGKIAWTPWVTLFDSKPFVVDDQGRYFEPDPSRWVRVEDVWRIHFDIESIYDFRQLGYHEYKKEFDGERVGLQRGVPPHQEPLRRQGGAGVAVGRP